MFDAWNFSLPFAFVPINSWSYLVCWNQIRENGRQNSVTKHKFDLPVSSTCCLSPYKLLPTNATYWTRVSGDLGDCSTRTLYTHSYTQFDFRAFFSICVMWIVHVVSSYCTLNLVIDVCACVRDQFLCFILNATVAIQVPWALGKGLDRKRCGIIGCLLDLYSQLIVSIGRTMVFVQNWRFKT